MTHYVGARLGGCLKSLSRRQDGPSEGDEEEEDVDVEKERYRLQDGMLLSPKSTTERKFSRA